MPNIKIKKYGNVFYHETLLAIGGIETYLRETVYKYAKKGYDIDLFYKKCKNDEHLKLIAECIGEDHIHKYNGEIIHCHTLFVNYDYQGFLENVFADEYINVIHANFLIESHYELHNDIRFTKRLAVSKENLKAYKKRFNLESEVCYNPINIKPQDTRKVLTLISATRLTKEKGKERMIRLMNELDKNHIPYYWHIFTNDIDDIKNPNVFYHTPTLDIRPYIKNADYLVQLSSSEGYCYSILEALCMGTPVITTDLPVFYEMGVINGKNGWILPLDMKDIPIKDIYETKLEFDYTPRKDNYEKYLYKGKTTYITEEIMKVKIIKPVKDTVAKVHYVSPREYGLSKINVDGWDNKPVGTIIDLPQSRAKVIVNAGYAIYVEAIDEVKKLKKPKAKTNLKGIK